LFVSPPGKGTTFYSWLGVSSSASMADIGRAYRKKSMLLQCVSRHPSCLSLLIRLTNCSPDKNPGVKGVQERFARLGVVASILRSEEGRERSVFCDNMRTTKADVPTKIRLLLQKWSTTLAWDWVLLFSIPPRTRGAPIISLLSMQPF
jgi:hypothetical protein